MENIFVEFLPPWVEANMQPAFYDKESGTVLQQTARMYDRVNMLVRMFNKLSKETKTVVETYIDKFDDLHDYVMDYFANLDVQEEINNKLDQMYDDGQLSEIIVEFLKLKGILGYDTVATMKSATEIVNGSLVETYGFYTKGDGGGAKYIIRTITNQDVIDEETLFALYDPTLVAELVVESEMNIAQFGLTGDGETDESTKLSIALACKGDDYLKLNFTNKTYLAQNIIYLYSNTHIDLNGATIKSCHDGTDTAYIEYGNGLRFMNNETSVATAGYGAIYNIEIKNGTFDGDESGVGFFILHGENINIENVTFKDCCVGTHVFDLGGCKDVRFTNCNFDGFLISNVNNKYREVIQTDYATYTGLPYWGEELPAFDNLPTINLTVDNCVFSKGSGTYYPCAIGTHSTGDYAIKNVLIKNCTFNGSGYSSIRFLVAEDVMIENNYFYANQGVGIRLRSYNKNIPINNITIKDNRFTLEGENHNAINIEGLTEEDVEYMCYGINVSDNICTGDWNGDDVTHDVFFLLVGDVENSVISNNIVNNCKFFIIKDNNKYFKNSTISDNKINYCENYICATNSDTEAYTIGSTGLAESNNTWNDGNITFNINNFKIFLTCSTSLQASEDSQTYYFAPFDENTSGIGQFVTNANYQFALPKCIRRFKLTGTFSIGCGANTAQKIMRLSMYDTQRNILASSKKNFVASEHDTTTFSAVVGSGHIEPTSRQYRVGMDTYLEKNDTINAKFGPGSLTTLLIEGY